MSLGNSIIALLQGHRYRPVADVVSVDGLSSESTHLAHNLLVVGYGGDTVITLVGAQWVREIGVDEVTEILDNGSPPDWVGANVTAVMLNREANSMIDNVLNEEEDQDDADALEHAVNTGSAEQLPGRIIALLLIRTAWLNGWQPQETEQLPTVPARPADEW